MCIKGVDNYSEVGYVFFGGATLLGILALGITSYSGITNGGSPIFVQEMYISSASILALGILGMTTLYCCNRKINASKSDTHSKPRNYFSFF